VVNPTVVPLALEKLVLSAVPSVVDSSVVDSSVVDSSVVDSSVVDSSVVDSSVVDSSLTVEHLAVPDSSIGPRVLVEVVDQLAVPIVVPPELGELDPLVEIAVEP
jgi:hypothetical protein